MSGLAASAKPAPKAERASAKGKRIAYVQYTNPAGYPPLEHSSQLFADAGWDALFLGAEVWGAPEMRLPQHARIRVRNLAAQRPGWRQKLHYLRFCFWCVASILRNRSHWIYASDLFSCPVAAAAAMLGIPVIYHEHDSPAPNPTSRFLRFCMWTRGVCGRRARLCILPNRRRSELFEEQTHAAKPALVVWNCPSIREVAAPRSFEGRQPMRFLYHGSIVPSRLPLEVIDALAGLEGEASLTVAGYETAGSAGYMEKLRRRAAEAGVESRLSLIGTLVARAELIEVSRRHDVGLALMPLESDDLNLRTMTGASNKPFDYLAGGLALLVSRLPDWEEMFVGPGYGLACDPVSRESLEAAMRRFIEHPEETRAMGERGRQRVLRDWNYEAQFRPATEMAGIA